MTILAARARPRATAFRTRHGADHAQVERFVRCLARPPIAQDVFPVRVSWPLEIKGQPEHLVAQLFHGEVAERIVALKAVAKSCEVSDIGVTASAHGYMTEPDAIDRCLSTVVDLAVAMAQRAFGVKNQSGPYR